MAKNNKKINRLKEKMQNIKKIDMNASNMILYSLLVFNIIIIVFISSIISYLRNLNECSCYKELNKQNYSNITYLLVIESIILAINIIYVITIVSLIMQKRNISNIIKNSYSTINTTKPNLTTYYVVYFIMLIIYLYFIYYVYKLHQNVKEECQCTENWFRYLLYIQAFLVLFNIVFGIVGMF
jgi:hypothetical protein